MLWEIAIFSKPFVLLDDWIIREKAMLRHPGKLRWSVLYLNLTLLLRRVIVLRQIAKEIENV